MLDKMNRTGFKISQQFTSSHRLTFLFHHLLPPHLACCLCSPDSTCTQSDSRTLTTILAEDIQENLLIDVGLYGYSHRQTCLHCPFAPFESISSPVLSPPIAGWNRWADGATLMVMVPIQSWIYGYFLCVCVDITYVPVPTLPRAESMKICGTRHFSVMLWKWNNDWGLVFIWSLRRCPNSQAHGGIPWICPTMFVTTVIIII